MCDWKDIIIYRKGGHIRIDATTIRDACEIIKQAAQEGRIITYTEIMNELKRRGHRKINRGTIGGIVGEVSIQVAKSTNPSIYPSAIVVRKDTGKPGEGFWGLDVGTNPPCKIDKNQREQALKRYQADVFNREWDCNC